MHHSFLPMLAALGALAYLAHRVGLPASRWAKLALAGLGFAVVKRQESTHRVLLFTAVPLVFLFIVFRARREDEVGAAGMGALLLYSGLDLAAYYYTFMLLPLLSRHQKLPRLAVLFGAQAVIYATALFEDRGRWASQEAVKLGRIRERGEARIHDRRQGSTRACGGAWGPRPH